MADQNQSHSTDHQATYQAFMGMTKFGIGAVSVLLILMAVFLVH